MTRIDLGKVGLTHGGNWSSQSSYERLTYVLYLEDGCGYIALRNNIGVTPGTDSTAWAKAAQAGKSIYQLCVQHGTFVGTEAEFVAEYTAAVAAAQSAATAAGEAAAAAAEVAAATTAAETARAAAETARVAAEAARAAAETSRASAETTRQNQETARQTASAAAVQACATAKEAADAAAVAADAAADDAKNLPYIGENGNWFVYDVEAGEYVDSGEHAQGPEGPTTVMHPVTYAELKALRDGGNLKPGHWSRLTDYQCVTTQAGTQAVNHPFDILIRADSASSLNENCYAAPHAGDTYFANQHLEAWKFKYTIDNERFAWGGYVHGKFFFAPSVSLNLSRAESQDTENVYGKAWELPAEYAQQLEIQYLYSKDETLFDWSDYLSAIPTDTIISDYAFRINDFGGGAVMNACTSEGKGVIYEMLDEYGNKLGFDFKNIQILTKVDEDGHYDADGTEVYAYTFNIATPMGMFDLSNDFQGFHAKSTVETPSDIISRNVWLASMADAPQIIISDNTFGALCYGNTFGADCSGNTFGALCYGNTFGADCSGNTFGAFDQNNEFGNYNLAYCDIAPYFKRNIVVFESENENPDLCFRRFGQMENKTIEISGGSYTRMTIAMNSRNQIKQYNEADLVQEETV